MRLKCNIGEYGVILNSNKEFLVLSLPINEEFTKEAWMLPGGRLNADDQPEEGLKREIFEETGLKVNVITPVHTARWGIEEPLKYSVFYLCEAVGDVEVRLSQEHVEYRWLKFDDIETVPWHNVNSKIAVEKSKPSLNIS